MAKLLLLFHVLTLTWVTAQPTASVQQSLDKLVNEAVEKDVFSGNVLVARNGKVLYERSVGYADIDKKINNTAQTRFAIGSITKIFTKILVHQLEEQGLVKKGSTLGSYLTGFPEPLQGITVQQLLDHTSGLGSYYDVPGYEEASKKFIGISDVLEYVKKEQLQFTPGSQTAYSNSGYAVLAGVVEKVTVKSYGQVLEENILKPLGLRHTRYTLRNQNESGKAVGYLSNLPGKKTRQQQHRHDWCRRWWHLQHYGRSACAHGFTDDRQQASFQ